MFSRVQRRGFVLGKRDILLKWSTIRNIIAVYLAFTVIQNAAELTYYGLYALQHRGQESAGIVTSDNGEFREHKRMGLVSQIFNGDVLRALKGPMAVGHVRYSTTGSSHLRNAQPLTGVIASAARSRSRTTVI